MPSSRLLAEVKDHPANFATYQMPVDTETIFLVDDADNVRSLARAVLQAAGYNVLEARNGAEAVRL